jgi:beta-lactam-binding protein with PASTA domain
MQAGFVFFATEHLSSMRVRGRNGRGNGDYPYRGDEETVALAERERPIQPPPGPPPPVPPPDDRDVWPWLLALVVLALAAVGAAYALTRNHGHHAARQQTVVVTQPVLPTGTTARKPVGPAVGKVPVPKVVGMPAPKAVAALAKAGFVPVRRLTASPKPKGTVVGEQPPALTKLARGATIGVLISGGPPLAVVPSLVSQTEQAATSSLSALGLKANVVQVSSTQQAGMVVAQNPKPGTKVPSSSSVRLNVSSGAASPTSPSPTQTSPSPVQTRKPTPGASAAATVSVPDLGGLKLAAARNAIRNAGLVTEIRYVPSQLEAGTVTGQSPKPGTTVKRGAHVFITVSRGGSTQRLKLVPNVVGQDEASARQTLRAAGFVVDGVDQPTSNQSQDGLVVREEPRGGTKAPSGSDITVYIARYSP